MAGYVKMVAVTWKMAVKMACTCVCVFLNVFQLPMVIVATNSKTLSEVQLSLTSSLINCLIHRKNTVYVRLFYNVSLLYNVKFLVSYVTRTQSTILVYTDIALE